MRDDLRRMALFGSGVAELTRNRAEQLARELVEKSKANRDELLKLMRAEIQNQIATVGVATKRDVERLERRVLRLETQMKELREKQRTDPKRTTASSTRGKAGAKKTPAKGTAAKKTTRARTSSEGKRT